jgi:hypothetical protein
MRHTMIGVACLASTLAVRGCTTVRETDATPTASQQLLVSTAAERAVDRLDLRVPGGTKVFLDTADFEGTDGKYVVGAVKDRLLRQGCLLVADKGQADTIVEIRAGALSTNEDETLIGIPPIGLPVPMAGAVSLPEVALYKSERRQGLAKIAATTYDAKTGGLVQSTGPQYGMSHKDNWVVLLFFDWTRHDLVPENERQRGIDVR